MPTTPPGTPVGAVPRQMSLGDEEPEMDAMERGIRARQREAEERKRRILAAYATVAKTQGAGPKTVCLEEYTNLAGGLRALNAITLNEIMRMLQRDTVS